MGLLDGLFGAKASNPAIVSAVEKYNADRSDESLLELWDKFLKGKLLLGTTVEGAKSYKKIKNVREAISLSFNTSTSDKGDILLSVYTDNDAFNQTVGESTPAVVSSGEEILDLAKVKGLIGIAINPRRSTSCELKCWQHALMIEKVTDANKLNAMATKFARAGNHSDAEGVLKGAILAAQKDPGPNHPFTAELNIDLAKAMHGQGKLIEAEWVYKRALSIYENSGSHDLDVATTAEALGTLCIDINKHDSAIPHLTRALSIYENVPGAKPDAIGKILSLLAEISLKSSNPEEAESYYKRATISLEEKKHPDVAIVLNKLGKLYENVERPKDALSTYLRTVSICESLKRCREVDLATALHRAGAINLQEGNIPEGEKLLERAEESYRKEGYGDRITEVQALLLAAKEKLEEEKRERERELEQSQPTRSKFGSPGKKPSDLPLLDFQSLKSNSKATYASTPKAEKPKAEAAPANPEEEALAKMRDFLNAVDKDGIAAASAKTPDHVQESFDLQAEEASIGQIAPAVEESISTMEDPFGGIGFEEPVAAIEEPVAAIEEPVTAIEEPVATIEEPVTAIEEPVATIEEPVTAIEEPVAAIEEPVATIEEPVATIEEPVATIKEPVATIEEPVATIEEPVAAIEEPVATIEEPVAAIEEPVAAIEEPVAAIEEPVAAIEKVANVAHTDEDAEMGVDELFSAPRSPKSASSSTAEPALEEKKDAANIFGKAIDQEVSQVFNRSAIGDLSKSDRYDRPISERLREDAAKASEKSAPAPASASTEANLFGKSIDSEISQIFNKSLVNDVAKSDRFDKPIAARDAGANLDIAAMEPAAHPEKESQLEPALSPPPPPPPPPIAKPKFDPNMTMSGLFLGELDSSLAEAFNAIMAEPKNTDSKFDRPIAERLADAEKSTPQPEPVTSAPPPVESVKADTIAEITPSAQSKPLDKDRFDKPVNVGSLNDEPNQLFQEELDSSLNTAFASLMAKNDAAAKGLVAKTESAEAVPAASTEVAQPKAQASPAIAKTEPVKPPKPPVDLSTAKNSTELIALIDQRLEDEPNNADLWLRKGTALVQQQRLDEAIKVFDKVTIMLPGDPKAWYCKGSSLHLKLQFEDALYCFNHVLTLDKDNIKAMLRKAECLMKLGRADQSLVLYDRILLLQPKFAAGWLSKARALLQQRRLQDSLDCYRQVLTLEPNNEEAIKANNLISSKLKTAAAT